MVLYHTSRAPLIGDIDPFYNADIEKARDFGIGFYMGPDAWKTKSMVGISEQLTLNRIKINFSNLNIARIDGLAWAMFVAYNRGILNSDSCPDYCQSIEDFVSQCDIIVGPIADDRTTLAVRMFANDAFSIGKFYELMTAINLDPQYVLKTRKSAQAIVEVVSNPVEHEEFPLISKSIVERQQESKQKFMEIKKKRKTDRHERMMLSDIIDIINDQKIMFDQDKIFGKSNEYFPLLRI